MPITVDWSVKVDGIDVTSNFNPYVQEVEVVDNAGTTSDTAKITLSDDGRIILPRKGAEMVVTIMGVEKFRGKTESPRLKGAKGGGGQMFLSAKGTDLEGKAKEKQHFSKSDTTLGEYLKAFAKRAGVSEIKVDPDLAKIKRAWWGPEGRSFMHEGHRLSQELGATFKIQGDKAVFAKRGSGKTPSGKDLPTITVRRPGNLINFDIEPFEARPVHRDVRVSGFDRKTAKFFEEKVDVEGSSSAASNRPAGKAATKDQAKAKAKGKQNEDDQDKGGGTVEIEIEPLACAEGTCILEGVREGADGTYRIEKATHTLKPGTASSTKLEVKQPKGKAGTDSRAKPTKKT